jgi:hypothetical protein
MLQMLQRNIGNQALLRLLSKGEVRRVGEDPDGDHEPEAAPVSIAAREAPRGAPWDFSKVPCRGHYEPETERGRVLNAHELSHVTQQIQTGHSIPQRLVGGDVLSINFTQDVAKVMTDAKLMVGAANDPLEREADRITEHIMRMSNPADVSTVRDSGAHRRKCACGGPTDDSGESEACKKVPETALHKASARSSPVGPFPPIVGEVIRSAGQPLEAATRAFFEPRFSYDFSQVRIHAGAHATESARVVNARAYTAAHDIVFGSGQYAPRTVGGLKLLAHELTHVVQQRGGAQIVQRQTSPAPTVSSPAYIPDRTDRQRLRFYVLSDMQTALKEIFTVADAALPATRGYTAMMRVRDNAMADISSELLEADKLLAGAGSAQGDQVQNRLERAELQLYLLPMYANLAALVRSAEIDRLVPEVTVQVSAESDRYAQVLAILADSRLGAEGLKIIRDKAPSWITGTRGMIGGLKAAIQRGEKWVATAEKIEKAIDVPIEFAKGLALPPQVLLLNLVVDQVGFGLAHAPQIAALAKSAPQFFNELFWLRDHAAVIRQHLIDPILAQIPGEALKSITVADIAFFLGRVLRTVEHAGGKVTWAIVIKAILKVAAILTLLDSPKWATHGLGHISTRTAESLMKAIGGPEDPYKILADLNTRLESKLPLDQAIALLLELTSPEVEQHLRYLAEAGAIVGPNIAAILADIESTGAMTAATAAAAQLVLPLLGPAP